jgi:transposase
MATERLSMRHTREILRQKWQLGRSHRQVRDSVQVSLGSIDGALTRATAAGLDWAKVEALSDAELEALLYKKAAVTQARRRALPDFAVVHAERKRVGVTLELLHMEYLEKHPDGYQYSRFCELYRQWCKRRGVTMRQEHRAGDKTFVDYSGKKPRIVDPKTGEANEVELFVAVLGASNYTFAEASMTQRGPDWIASHQHAFAYFGGVTAAVVPDQLKSGVTRPCRYEPGVQRTYEEMAQHYGTTVLPARPGKARDKAKVEVAVQIAQRWILARLRNQTFFSLDALNERIAELVEELNDRRMRVYGCSRRELYERIERATLRPLPTEPFVYGEWKIGLRVNIDYHVDVDHHYYSVHFTLAREEVDVRVAAMTVEIFHDHRRVAAHPRSWARGRHTTTSAHMPVRHQKHLEWTPSRLIHWAGTIGPGTARLVEAILADRPHPEQGYRSCLGILRLGKRYGEARLEAACARAFAAGARSYRHVDSILKSGLDRVPVESDPPAAPTTDDGMHDNIRGPKYYH